jgi:hypothetical protein
MKFKTTIPDEPTLGITAISGATKVAGKTNGPEAVLLGNDPGTRPASAVKDAEEVKGCAARCIAEQLRSDEIDGTTSSPKKRDANTFGIGHADDENRKALTK